MSSWLLLVTVFAVTFVAELPDKSLFASLVLGTRYRPGHVWLGVAAAFALHVTLSVAAGGLLTLAPKSVIDFVSAGLFLGGAIWMLRAGARPDEDEPGPDAARTFYEYVYLRDNPAGPHRELWYHSAGCHGWLVVTRDTRTHAIGAVTQVGAP